MSAQTFPFCRVIVVGATGSGKSTLAEKLARKLDLEFLELDAIHWLPGWEHLSDADFRAKVDQATRSLRWAIAGNYSVARDVTWPRAEAVIWLDYSFWTIFWQLWRRTWRRWRDQELLWGTNRERFWPHFKIWSAEDSLFAWLLKTYWRRKREIPAFLARPEYAHLKLFHLKTPQETAKWLADLSVFVISKEPLCGD